MNRIIFFASLSVFLLFGTSCVTKRKFDRTELRKNKLMIDSASAHAELDELVQAYACTVHKSQGSEYPPVVLVLHTQHFKLLQRNLLYTGITRGRRLVCIVGSQQAIRMAIRNNLVVERRTSEAGGPARGLRAIARYADGSTADVTELCDWSSEDPAALDVSSIPGQRGELIFGTGSARISAGMAGLRTLFDVNP